MPTASKSMVETLTRDLAPLEKKVASLQDYANEYDTSEFTGKIATLADPMSKIKQRVDKWDREINERPPNYPEETAYKTIRAALTKLVSVVEALDKKVKVEKKAFDAGVTVKVANAARSEILVNDAKLAQALAAVSRGDKGRTSPKVEELDPINHIHIGGNAKYNLIFDPGKRVALGTVNFHMDSTMNKSQRDKVKKVSSRSTSSFLVKIVNKKEIVAVD